MALRPGELCFLAVGSDEPAGKPIIACRKVQVALELAAPEDQQSLHRDGLAVMRQGRLARLARRRAQRVGPLLRPRAGATTGVENGCIAKWCLDGSRRWSGSWMCRSVRPLGVERPDRAARMLRPPGRLVRL